MRHHRTDVNAHALAAGIVFRSELESEARAVATEYPGAEVYADRIDVWTVKVEPAAVLEELLNEALPLDLRGELDRLAGEISRLYYADPESTRFDEREHLYMRHAQLSRAYAAA